MTTGRFNFKGSTPENNVGNYVMGKYGFGFVPTPSMPGYRGANPAAPSPAPSFSLGGSGPVNAIQRWTGQGGAGSPIMDVPAFTPSNFGNDWLSTVSGGGNENTSSEQPKTPDRNAEDIRKNFMAMGGSDRLWHKNQVALGIRPKIDARTSTDVSGASVVDSIRSGWGWGKSPDTASSEIQAKLDQRKQSLPY